MIKKDIFKYEYNQIDQKVMSYFDLNPTCT